MPGGNSPRALGDGIILPALIFVRNSANDDTTFLLYQEHELIDEFAWEKGNDDRLPTVNEVLAPHPDAECATMSPILWQKGTAMSQQHTDSVHNSPIVAGTIEWPTIKNTRVTLFDLMDHLKQGLPPHFVAHWYHLTSEEMDEVMQFLKAHEAEIERSYAAANARAAAQRRYWEARNRHVLTSDVGQLPLPSQADARWLDLRATFLAARKKCGEQPNSTHADPH